MIRDDRDLISRRDFYHYVSKRMTEKGHVLDSSLTLREVLEIFEQMLTQDELSAEWIKESDKWVCTWCRMGSHAPYTTKYCPNCGRRMKVKVNL